LDLAERNKLTFVNFDQVICLSKRHLRGGRWLAQSFVFFKGDIPTGGQARLLRGFVKATAFEARPRELLDQLVVLVTETIGHMLRAVVFIFRARASAQRLLNVLRRRSRHLMLLAWR